MRSEYYGAPFTCTRTTQSSGRIFSISIQQSTGEVYSEELMIASFYKGQQQQLRKMVVEQKKEWIGRTFGVDELESIFITIN